MKAASSESRNATDPAISSGVPTGKPGGVNGHDALELFGRVFKQGESFAVNTGVIEETVDGAEGLHGVRHVRLYVFFVGDVSYAGDDFSIRNRGNDLFLGFC